MEREKGKEGEREGTRERGERNPTGYQRNPEHRWVHYGPLCPERETKLSWRHKHILVNPPCFGNLGQCKIVSSRAPFPRCSTQGEGCHRR